MTTPVATTNSTLFVSKRDSRDNSANRPPIPILGARQANKSNDEPVTTANSIRRNTPRRGSVAKAWTEVRKPERTRKPPSNDTEKELKETSKSKIERKRVRKG